MVNNAVPHNKIRFSTILPPLRLLLLRTYLYHSIYKKNYRCAASLLTRETDRFAGIKKRLRRANRRGSRRTFGKLQESPANLQFRSQSVRRFSDGSPRACMYSFPLRDFSRSFITCSVYAPTRCDSFTPRGGGHRDRERLANLSLSLRHLSTHSGDTAAAGSLPLTARASAI